MGSCRSICAQCLVDREMVEYNETHFIFIFTGSYTQAAHVGYNYLSYRCAQMQESWVCIFANVKPYHDLRVWTCLANI